MSDIMREAEAAAGRLLLVAEACASVSASHPLGCPCVVCRAKGGDVEALMEVEYAIWSHRG